MRPIDFKESNSILTKPQNMTDEECSSLNIYTDGTECISCWKLSFKDRIMALVFGHIWLGVLYGQTQPPVWLDARRTVFIKQKEGDI